MSYYLPTSNHLPRPGGLPVMGLTSAAREAFPGALQCTITFRAGLETGSAVCGRPDLDIVGRPSGWL